MPIEKWSEQISIARLASDTHFTDEIEALGEHASTAASDIVLDLTTVRYVNSSPQVIDQAPPGGPQRAFAGRRL